MSNKISIPRIKNVRLKEGGAQLHVLPDARARNRADIEAAMFDILKLHEGPLAGMALVLWGSDGSTTTKMIVNSTSQIPGILVPDLVRNCLLARRIESWTLETVNDQWGR